MSENTNQTHDGTSLGDAIRGKQRIFKELSFPEKLGFIWDYYKVHIMLGLLVAAIVLILLHGYLTNTKDLLLYGMNCNVVTDEEITYNLPNDYMAYSGANAKKYEVIYEGYLFNGHEGLNPQNEYASVMKLSTTIASQQLDFLFCDTVQFDTYSAQAGFYNLEELLPADLFAQLEAEGRIVYGEPSAESNAAILTPYAMVIDVTDTAFASRYNMSAYNDGPLYLGIITNTTRPEECVNLVRWVFGMDYVPTTTN